jgi:hypothetical protein
MSVEKAGEGSPLVRSTGKADPQQPPKSAESGRSYSQEKTKEAQRIAGIEHSILGDEEEAEKPPPTPPGIKPYIHIDEGMQKAEGMQKKRGGLSTAGSVSYVQEGRRLFQVRYKMHTDQKKVPAMTPEEAKANLKYICNTNNEKEIPVIVNELIRKINTHIEELDLQDLTSAKIESIAKQIGINLPWYEKVALHVAKTDDIQKILPEKLSILLSRLCEKANITLTDAIKGDD